MSTGAAPLVWRRHGDSAAATKIYGVTITVPRSPFIRVTIAVLSPRDPMDGTSLFTLLAEHGWHPNLNNVTRKGG